MHGFGPHVQTTEEGPYYPLCSPYQRTKKQAEEAVLAGNGPGFRTVVLRPADVYGPGDTTTFYRLLAAQERGIRGTLGGGLHLTSLLAVEDLVQAVALALEREKSAGQVFNITSGEPNTWRQLLGYTASLLGARPWLELPLFVARPAAAVLAAIYRIPGHPQGPAAHPLPGGARGIRLRFFDREGPAGAGFFSRCRLAGGAGPDRGGLSCGAVAASMTFL